MIACNELNAERATAIRDDSVRPDVVDRWLSHIACRIEKAAKGGKCYLDRMLKGFWMPKLTDKEFQVVCAELKARGFVIVQHYPLAGLYCDIAWGNPTPTPQPPKPEAPANVVAREGCPRTRPIRTHV